MLYGYLNVNIHYSNVFRFNSPLLPIPLLQLYIVFIFLLNPFLVTCSQSRRSRKASHWICCDWRTPGSQVNLLLSPTLLNSSVTKVLMRYIYPHPSGCYLWPRSMAEWSPSQERWTTSNTPWALCSHWSPTTSVQFNVDQRSTCFSFIGSPDSCVTLSLFILQSCASAAMHPVYYVHSEGRLLGKWTPTRGWWTSSMNTARRNSWSW